MIETHTSRASADQLPAPNTAEAASLYQCLRGQLGVLELADAAEALPAVLDQAAAEELSMTAALERLLSIEVAATEARLLTGRLRFACLPTPASLEDFDFDNAAGVDKKLVDELATCRYSETATNVLLIGPPGSGRRICRSGWRGPKPTPGIAHSSPPQPISRPDAIGLRSTVGGRRRCGSMRADAVGDRRARVSTAAG